MLPDRLTRIDEVTRGTHHFLTEEDRCMYFGEFFSRKGWSAGPTNQLITNYKRTPAEIASHPKGQQFQYFKDKAIADIAAGLRAQFTPQDVATNYTFVPMPSSQIASDSGFCDRLNITLRRAFSSPPYTDADIRPLLRQTRSVEADQRRASGRISFDDLLEITEVDAAQLQTPVRSEIVLFDDVLTSGKHYVVAKTRIREALPNHPLIGLFVARANHPNPFDEL